MFWGRLEFRLPILHVRRVIHHRFSMFFFILFIFLSSFLWVFTCETDTCFLCYNTIFHKPHLNTGSHSVHIVFDGFCVCVCVRFFHWLIWNGKYQNCRFPQWIGDGLSTKSLIPISYESLTKLKIHFGSSSMFNITIESAKCHQSFTGKWNNWWRLRRSQYGKTSTHFETRQLAPKNSTETT